MSKKESSESAPQSGGRAGRARRSPRALASLAFTLLAVEFLDELVDGARQASWALVRSDLALSYTQIGLLLTVPPLFGNAVEPALHLLGDTRRRRALILGGGACFVLSCALVASSRGFWSLLLALAAFNPASGAFVGLSQASLMDTDPARREQNMARWVFAGSVGVLAGSILLGACVAAGAGWRACFGAISVVALVVVLRVRRLPVGTRGGEQGTDARGAQVSGGDDGHDGRTREGFAESARAALGALRRAEVWRWLVLLEVADLMLDGFRGYVALYFVDVVGMGEASVAFAVAVWSGFGLAGDFLLIPLLERVRGLRYLRWSALVMLLLLPAFLAAPSVAVKLALAGLIGVCNTGWYSILKARLYAALPGRSGAALALSNVTGFAGSLIPLALGLFAERFGLSAAMWLLLVSPAALLAALPRGTKDRAA
ncbi:MAG TPA: MFS transporter [Pyrinomonadaceae bacterium]|jgi:FSR family fosmidomycin resistance protein-like MFS transporter|nr:MFS transporter [Pyrinomonadaceae bacterium]